ncbi:MAG TPA: DUF6056 family protein [Anaerolineales bacterium]|nr:DUF6056 family protein [Anaerolineales bacterium]
MKDHSSPTKQPVSEEASLKLVLSLGIVTALIALALYAYLGVFSRYGSDDYCLSAFFLQDDLFGAMIRRYIGASSRYTNILFIGLVDNLFGWYNVAILPGLMLALFVWGMYLLLKEIVEMTGAGWSRLTTLFLAILIVYFSEMQAPDLYETLYWRAGMTSHFAPVVFIPFFGAFILRQIRRVQSYAPSFWVQAACFIIPFVIGGLSEPPTAVMITVLVLGIGATWWWSDVQHRRSILTILFWSLLGAVTALLLMAFAPANSIRMQTAPPAPPELLFRVIKYPAEFIVDTLRVLPTPTLISVAVPALLFYVKYSHPSQSLSGEARVRLGLFMLIVLFLGYLLIAASFAPSAYGQSYPAPRARFSGRVLMTGALMAEGALLGTLIAQAGKKILQSITLRRVAMVALAILVLYPLRTAQRTAVEIPVYQERAAAWDLRETEIRAMKEDGAQDLVVRFLGEERTQDLGDQADFRLNRCAAALYGVNSIVAVPMDKRPK